MIAQLAVMAYREVKGCPFPMSKELIAQYIATIDKERHNYPNIHHHGYTKLIVYWYQQSGKKLRQKELFAIADILNLSKQKLYKHYQEPEPPKPTTQTQNFDYNAWQQAKTMTEFATFE